MRLNPSPLSFFRLISFAAAGDALGLHHSAVNHSARKNSALSRSPFTLSDEQAGKLLVLSRELNDKHPLGGPSNRPFVHDFIKAVHTATGRTFSPAIYRRLLDTYGPERKPSTNTLALEKEAVERELASATMPPPAPAPASGLPALPLAPGDLVDQVRRAVEDVLGQQFKMATGALREEQQMAQLHIADLGSRLAASDRALAEARGHAAQLAADLQLARERASDMATRLEQTELDAKAQRDLQIEAMRRVATELDEMRKFAMRAIDDVRGETRAERERRLQLEELLKKNERLTEVFRQMAYQRGGAVPPELRMEQPG